MTKERPLYLIAHRCNNKGDITNALALGANAFECDVRYGEKDNDWCVNHDAYRPKVSIRLCEWLEEAYNIDDKGQMCFLLLDIKNPDYLNNLIDYVHQHTNDLIEKRGKAIAVLYSIANLDTAKELFAKNVSFLKEWEGITVDYKNDPREVNNYYVEIQEDERKKGREFNRFLYGNGITAALPDTEALRKSLALAGELRDKKQVIKKTYIWTIEKQSTAEKYLEIGVDGILTNAGGGDVPRNKIQNIINAMKEHNQKYPDKKVRKATTDDNLFAVFR